MDSRAIGTMAVLCTGFSLMLHSFGAIGQTDETKPGRVVLTKLARVSYPQMAQIAQVTGEVAVQVRVRPDGSVSSAQILSTASPLLSQAALSNARQSTFECQRCSGEADATVTYQFRLRAGGCGYVARARGFKCAYLWKCGALRYHGHQLAVTRTGSFIRVLAEKLCVNTSTEIAERFSNQ